MQAERWKIGWTYFNPMMTDETIPVLLELTQVET